MTACIVWRCGRPAIVDGTWCERHAVGPHAVASRPAMDAADLATWTDDDRARHAARLARSVQSWRTALASGASDVLADLTR